MIIHIDMDAFYASVEEREHPELVGKPVIVGGAHSNRGVVSAANYIARTYGIHSAMPVTQALRLCPDVINLPVNMSLYVDVSRQVFDIFRRYTPEIEPLSIDEAFLDVRGSLKLFGSAPEIAQKIKADIKNELRLVASAGVAPNKFVAKIASDIDKPDGFVVVKQEELQSFLDPLPVKRLWGVGKKTEEQLLKYGIYTVADVRLQKLHWLQERFGKLGDHIYRLAHGEDKRQVISDAKAKSISAETTFNDDVSDRDVLLSTLSQLTEQVAARLRQKELKGKTINIKIRYHDFKTLTRSKTLPSVTSQTNTIWQAARNLLDSVLGPTFQPVRLIGVGVSGFDKEDNFQADLFSQDKKHTELDGVTDEINKRFGKAKIHRGRKI